MVRKAHNIRGYVRPMARLTAKAQADALAPHCLVDHVYTEGNGPETLEGAIRSLRRGDVLAVKLLHVLAPPKLSTRDNPRRDLWAAIRAIEARGASILEVDTGRSSLKQRDRDDMIAQAIETITKAGRSLTHRQAKARGLKGGRPAREFSAEDERQAREHWFSLKHATNADAAKEAGGGWNVYQMRKRFGPSGRSRS